MNLKVSALIINIKGVMVIMLVWWYLAGKVLHLLIASVWQTNSYMVMHSFDQVPGASLLSVYYFLLLLFTLYYYGCVDVRTLTIRTNIYVQHSASQQ